MRCVVFVLCLALLACSTAVRAQGTAFSYQGKLVLNGAVVDAPTDFRFSLYPSAVSDVQNGSTLLVNDQAVSNGVFTVSLDFGTSIFNGTSRWLEIEVRPGDSVGAYTKLTPRQQILPAPYAIFAGGVSGSNITAPILLPQSSAGSVGYGFSLDSNTGMFSPTQNTVGLATTGVERVRIDPAGNVGIGTTANNTYRLMVAGANHQIALNDTDSGKTWTLTTVSNTGFGIYEDGATARLTISAGGTVGVAGGKAVVYNSNGTELMTLRATATLSVANLAPNTGVDGTQNWGNQGFTSPPTVIVGNFEPGPSGMQDFDHFTVTCHSVTTTGCKVRIFNAGSTAATITGGQWSLLVVGTR